MTTLTEFLLARIAEDESAARELDAVDTPHVGECAYDMIEFGRECVCGYPERVLRECAAKRRIVELRYSWNLQAERNPEPPFGPILQAQVITADSALRTLASVYSDHPDYLPEWRP